MNLTDEEIKRLRGTRNESEWNKTCDDIKAARGGQYPPDWWQEMMMSGLIASIQATWS